MADTVPAEDVFVFRRVAERRYVHVGGSGRGRGWAGNIDVHLDEEPLLRAAHDRAVPVRVTAPGPSLVLGPYYARFAVAVSTSHDVIVVFGGSSTDVTAHNDATLETAAATVSATIESVAPSKRLADELEVLHAISALMQAEVTDIDDAFRHVLRCATAALSCEVGAMWCPSSDRLVIHQDGWDLGSTEDEVRAALRQLGSALHPLPHCAQDVSMGPSVPPFDTAHGVRSIYLLTIEPQGVLLVLGHTDAAPRGFTNLCRALGVRLSEAATSVLRTAELRAELQREIAAVTSSARRDPLTGLGNRLAWEEAVDAEQDRVDIGGESAVLVVDMNLLKVANDELGHDVGDRLLCAVAAVLRDSTRDGDVVVRLGGDEFGILLPGADEATCLDVRSRIERALTAHPLIEGMALSAAVGHATCEAAARIDQAVRLADQRMYASKLEGRRSLPSA